MLVLCVCVLCFVMSNDDCTKKLWLHFEVAASYLSHNFVQCNAKNAKPTNIDSSVMYPNASGKVEVHAIQQGKKQSEKEIAR